MFGVDTAIYIMLIVAVIAAAASAYAMYESGQQQKKMAKYNAKMLERQAEMQKNIGRARADDIRHRNRVMMAASEAQIGASGVDFAPGTSPLAVLAYNAREAELDALRAEWSGDANADASFAEARLMRYKGNVAEYTSNMQAGTTLLSGLSSAGQMYYGATASKPAGGGGGGTWMKSSSGYSSNMNNWGSYL